MNYRVTMLTHIVCFLFLATVIQTSSCFDENRIDECDEHTVAEKHFVVVIPSRNNKQWYERNLGSVFKQKYSNYHVIYIDDDSPDGTGDYVAQYCCDCGFKDKVTLIKNEKRRGALANLYTAIHLCDDDHIVITIDGDDWLNGDDVFERLNRIYSDRNVWMTYGSYENHPQGTRGNARQIPLGVIRHNAYRECEWTSTHLRTFYAWLFKCIKLEDLLYKGNFFSVTWDMAMLFPMLEMAGERSRFIEDILYIYNQETPFNDFKLHLILQLHCDKLIRSKEKYQLLKKKPVRCHDHAKQHVDGIIFSCDRPMHLMVLLQSLKSVSGVGTMSVLYQASNGEYERAYKKVQEQFTHINFYNALSFRDCLLTVVKSLPEGFLFFAYDGLLVKKKIDLTTYVSMLEKTYAYAYYLTLDSQSIKNKGLTRLQQVPVSVNVEGTVYAWQFHEGEFDWRDQHTLSMAIYRTADIKKLLSEIEFTDISMLQQLWNKTKFDLSHIGLYDEESPIAVLEDMVSNEALLKYFNSNFKIDIADFWDDGDRAARSVVV